MQCCIVSVWLMRSRQGFMQVGEKAILAFEFAQALRTYGVCWHHTDMCACTQKWMHRHVRKQKAQERGRIIILVSAIDPGTCCKFSLCT